MTYWAVSEMKISAPEFTGHDFYLALLLQVIVVCTFKCRRTLSLSLTMDSVYAIAQLTICSFEPL
jgi:hypothetical protein